MRYHVICFHDDYAGETASFESMEFAQAACDGIDLTDRDRYLGVIFDLDNECVCWPLAEDIGDDEFVAAIRVAATRKMADAINAKTTPETA